MISDVIVVSFASDSKSKSMNSSTRQGLLASKKEKKKIWEPSKILNSEDNSQFGSECYLKYAELLMQ